MTPPYKTFVDVVSTTSGPREFKNPKSISSGVRIAILDDAIGTFDGTKGDDDDVRRSHRDDEDKDEVEDDEDDEHLVVNFREEEEGLILIEQKGAHEDATKVNLGPCACACGETRELTP
mmetsp:Transcript_817/g.1784  ORF Transcript_817/g.1784 Transcript_817/m.1784 type:complete len:119 (-) Transcript_817:166-522(-)